MQPATGAQPQVRQPARARTRAVGTYADENCPDCIDPGPHPLTGDGRAECVGCDNTWYPHPRNVRAYPGG